MPNPHMSTQDWFYHAPSARSTGPSHIKLKPTSQIPGLSTMGDEETDQDDRHFKRKWIRDTDSKYVRLAKAGGRKHLLAFNNSPKLSTNPVVYPRVDWFDHDHPGEEEPQDKKDNDQPAPGVLPEWYIHEQPQDDKSENNQEHKRSPDVQRPMLGFDSLSVWQRKDEQGDGEKTAETKSPKLPKIKKKKLFSSTKLTKVPVKLPKLKGEVNRSDLDLDMKRLLSMDYQREWLLNKSIEESKEAEHKQVIEKEKQEREQRIANHHQQSLKSKKEVVREKPLFKLSRFQKVKPCVDTRWSKLETKEKPVAH